ncbi:MAG: hypothetical protein EXS42_05025 [Lacunisphaera sp.]|nr:hypothetical protein [Lacunisphaera sp.]
MKKLLLLLALAAAAIAAVVIVNRHDHSHADKSAAMASPAVPDAAWLAKAKAEYPLKTCSVSDEEIGGAMGEGIDHVYKQAGKPDRLVRFCCKDCLKDFNQDPAKYLQLIAEAAAKAKKS